MVRARVVLIRLIRLIPDEVVLTVDGSTLVGLKPGGAVANLAVTDCLDVAFEHEW